MCSSDLFPSHDITQYRYQARRTNMKHRRFLKGKCLDKTKTSPRRSYFKYRVLTAHYPPLDYCHSEDNGFDLLSDYVAIAKTVF